MQVERLRKSRFAVRLRGGLFVIAWVAACGPPLTQPSSQDITGHWTSGDQVGPLSNLQLNITQQADGSVSGSWSGKFFPPTATCPPGLGSDPNGPVQGT